MNQIRILYHFLRRLVVYGIRTAVRGDASIVDARPAPWFRMLRERRPCVPAEDNSVKIVLSFGWKGGASSYLAGRLKSDLREEYVLVARPFGCKGWLAVEAWKNAKRVRTCVARGLSSFLSLQKDLPRMKVEIVVNEIYTWQVYAGSRTFSAALLDGLFSEILELRKGLDARLTYLVHDYFPICPMVFMADGTDRYCGDEKDAGKCRDCIRRGGGWSGSVDKESIDVGKWREAARRIFECSDEVRCFSGDTKGRLMSYLGPKIAYSVVPHDFVPPDNWRRPALSSGPMTVGFFGGGVPLKGIGKVRELCRLMEGDGGRVVVAGEVRGGTMPENCTVLGRYRREDMPAIVEKYGINVAFFASICPETFSYVVQELMMLGLPVVCFDIGAPSERVRAYEWGRVARCFDVGHVHELLSELHRKRSLVS